MIGKKICPLFLAAVLIASMGSFSYAEPLGTSDNADALTPYFVAINNIMTSLTFESGKAYCGVMVNVSQTKADSVKFNITLQKKVGTTWTSLVSWEQTVSVGSSNYALFESRYNVGSGYYYRFKGTTTCYKNGSVVEAPSFESATVYF
ncbi:MAG: hypothetical protein LBQ48_00520 [Oscillospiraceae bacterium]|jgi:hypothetical protein|nr:hypothetical protein [Oscillospiraceae bacterium]